jgi:hypothetical protein
VPGAEDLDRLLLLQAVDQELVGLGLLQVVDRADRREDAGADHRHHVRIDRRSLAHLHPGHLEVALAHGFERLGHGIERAGVVEARLAARNHLRQSLGEMLHRQRRGVRRSGEIGDESKHYGLRGLRMGRQREARCEERGERRASETTSAVLLHHVLLL